MRPPMGPIEAQLRRVLLAAADSLELPLTVKQVEALATGVALAMVTESLLPLEGAPLTRVQSETLCSVANGYTNAEIAHQLGRHESTVARNLHRGSRRLGARNRTHAVAIAFAVGLITPSQIVPVEGGDRP